VSVVSRLVADESIQAYYTRGSEVSEEEFDVIVMNVRLRTFFTLGGASMTACPAFGMAAIADAGVMRAGVPEEGLGDIVECMCGTDM